MRENLDETYKQMWDERYSSESYVYDKEPNKFFRDWLHHFKPGSILMPADGEGRNGVYAAKEGWAVTSLDLSEAGKLKALALADERWVIRTTSTLLKMRGFTHINRFSSRATEHGYSYLYT